MQIDIGATLNLETALITGGTLTNSGMLDANASLTNAINNAILITNHAGATIEATGAGVELQIKSATTFNNDGTLLATLGGTLDLDSLTVANSATGLVQVDASSTLDLETALITGGTLTNSGMLDANASLTNAINNAILITNHAGATIEATGAGVELQIKSATTFNNDGTLLATLGGTLDLDSLTVANSATGLVQVDASSTLDLETALITGGTLTNSGMLDANASLTNAINNAILITNHAGATIFEATGAGVELQIKSATTFNHDGTLLATLGGTLDLDSLTVANSATGLVQVDASSTLDLETALITGGTLTNSGMLDANASLTNAINNAILITNHAGATIEATGAGVELQIKSATTFNNDGTYRRRRWAARSTSTA